MVNQNPNVTPKNPRFQHLLSHVFNTIVRVSPSIRPKPKPELGFTLITFFPIYISLYMLP